MMFAFPVLLGDIGGTNARFGVLPAPGGPIHFLPRMQTAAAPGPVQAIRETLLGYDGPAPRSAMIALANRVDSIAVRLTNADWVVDAAAIGSAFNLDRVALINDYPPVAASATVLDAERGHVAHLGGLHPAGAGTRVVLGPGTGFGAAALLVVENRYAIVPTEAGHIEFGPTTDEETRLWPYLERVGGRVTVESVLSGPGLLRLARALAALRRADVSFTAPNDILLGARNGQPLAVEVLELFARFLGRVAGDLALLFEAVGGVFIAGGIAPRMVDILQQGAFRDAFDRKAPHHDWARRVPASVIVHPEPALLGLSALVTNPERFVVHVESWQAAN
jgi:glucokinase